MGTMNYTLRAVLLLPRAQIILLQQAGAAELAGSVQEGLRRAGEISLSSDWDLFPSDRGVVHS